MATPNRNVRIPDDVWDAAKGKAAGEGTELPAVIAALLRGYVAGGAVMQAPACNAGSEAAAAPVMQAGATTGLPPGGIPSPGVICYWPRCGNRDTRRYGVTDPGELARRTGPHDALRDEDSVGLPLCPAHAVRLAGVIYWRPETVPLRKIHA